MSTAEARYQLIAAVRRDLYGPTGTEDRQWPGAEPKTLRPCAAFESARDLVGVFVDDDGNEILSGSPLRRYGIGILFPSGLSRRQEAALDVAQEDVAHEAADLEAAVGTENLEPPPPQPETSDGPADAADAEDDGGSEPWRPRSMAVSFLCAPDVTAPLTVRVTGGRYEPFSAHVAGNASTFWRRRPVEVTATFDLQADGAYDVDLTDGLLQLRVGAAFRPHATGTIVTVYVLNRGAGGADLAAATEASLLQAELRVELQREAVLDYPQADVVDGEDRSLELLYHREPVRAVGHGCNATADNHENTTAVVGSHFPVEHVRSPVPEAVDENGKPLQVDMDDLGAWTDDARTAVTDVLDAYERWINRQRASVPELPAPLQSTAERHLRACDTFLADAREGWELANTDATVELVLRWTSVAMANQRRAYAAETRRLVIANNKVTGVEGESPHTASRCSSARWRAFQIAFVLASLPAVVDPADRRREQVDIIWMPTGGGKTEAYSGLAAFAMLWRRYHQVATGARLAGQGSTVLMRYTLRLLTAQQLQRAAALICALEQIRRQNTDKLGAGRKFTIGAWLGSRSTPNDWSAARRGLTEWKSDATKRAFLLTRCPWCAAAIGRRPGMGQQQIDGYKTTPVPDSSDTRVMAYCPDRACPFNDENQRLAGEKPSGLPVYEVDRDLYVQAPTFVVGTIDKFAQLSWRSDPAAFFGLSNGTRTGPGPALLIQDELHLISGPLGSLDALYEPVIEDLCTRDGGEMPKIVAATATTRRYVEQIAALYGRTATRLVPPPGLDAADNFFSRTNPDSTGKVFVGICAPGFGKAQEAQVRILAALGHAAGSLEAAGETADPWWTNLCFFSSRRTLGMVQSLCQTHLRGHSWRLHRATGVHAGPARATGTRLTQRSMVSRVELTAQATADVSEAMGRLSIPLTDKGAADLCFATSMIEVGVDIDRLGLLTMFGQPKSASQYIQVAGRVGRDERKAPGVVFVVLSPYNSRDKSHFEHFSVFHRRLYASVEPVSITPFTPAALERGLAGAVTAWVRQATYTPNPKDARSALDMPIGLYEARTADSPTAAAHLRRRADELRVLLDQTTHETWGTLRPGQPSDGFLRPLGDVTMSADDPEALTTHWLVPTSMRSVDAESGARNIFHTKATSAATPGTAGPAADDEEDLF